MKLQAQSLKRFTEPLKIYIRNLGGEASACILELKPVIVKGLYPLDSFEAAVREEIRRSRGRASVEMRAVELIKDYLKSQGYSIVEDYYSGPRAFDMVVERNGRKYTVECKGRFLRPGEQPAIILTANEMEWGMKYCDRHLICIAIMESDRVNVESYTFREFLENWDIR